MSLVEMKKLYLIGLNSERERIMDTLFQTGNAEVVRTEEMEQVEYYPDPKRNASYAEKLAKLEDAIELVESTLQKKGYAEIFADFHKNITMESLPEFVKLEDFTGVSTMEMELMGKLDELKDIQQTINELMLQNSHMENQLQQLAFYQSLDVAFDRIADSKHVFMRLGSMPEENCNTLMETMAAQKEEFAYCFCVQLPNPSVKYRTVFVSGHMDCRENVQNLLAELAFSPCAFHDAMTASEKTSELNRMIAMNQGKLRSLTADIADYAALLNDWKLLYDYYIFKLDKAEAEDGFLRTRSTFILEAWIPADRVEMVQADLRQENYSIVLQFVDAKETDSPPTATRNGKVVQHFECITNMYSAPVYRELDPNRFVTFFFWLFFGMMMADAGYGILITLASAGFLLFGKPRKTVKDMAYVFLYGGISTFIWGALFGSWFGAELLPPIAFAPLDDPILLLLISLMLGVLQVLVGMGISGYAQWKSGDRWGSFFDVGSWFMIFIGIGLFVLSMLAVPAAKIAGIALIVGGLVIILITNGRNKSSVLGKMFGGVSKLYNIVNLFSDILSYSRLFGLGVASSVVGMVINLIASMMWGNPIGMIFAVILLIFGHLFNIALSLLSAYVHGARLQYIEFFGKFYTGDGHLFAPLGSNLKYNVVKLKD